MTTARTAAIASVTTSWPITVWAFATRSSGYDATDWNSRVVARSTPSVAPEATRTARTANTIAHDTATPIVHRGARRTAASARDTRRQYLSPRDLRRARRPRGGALGAPLARRDAPGLRRPR